jgi:hypothetical protein
MAPARIAVGVSGRLGGLTTKRDPTLAIQDEMVFSLDVLPAREDGWDRDAIVRGFWGCRDFG